MSKTRDAYIDNVKGVLIFLVVLGHMVNPFIDSERGYKTTFDFIYAFHMPLFIFISGMFSRAMRTSEAIKRYLPTILLPFFLFHLLYELSDILIRGEPSYYTKNLQPYWIMWYLWSLFLWKLAITVLPRTGITFIAAVIFAVAFNIVIETNLPFGFNRTVSFFPFFLVGYLWGDRIVPWARNLPLTVSIAGLAMALIYFWWNSDFNSPVFFHSETMRQLYPDMTQALVVTLLVYGFSAVISLLVLRIIPTWQSYLTTIGRNSLYVYLWHGFVVRVMTISGILASMTAALPAVTNLAVVIAASIMITAALGLPFITRWSETVVRRIGSRLGGVITGTARL